MVKTRRAFITSPLASALAATVPIRARAAAWRQRPVKFIVPFGPGAGADIGARVFADKLQAPWGQPVVVQNHPGGDSIVAITAFLNVNDDHAFLFAPSGNFAVHPFIYGKLPYDPNELVPIARVSNTILGVAVKIDSPFATVKDFYRSGQESAPQIQWRDGARRHRIYLLGLRGRRRHHRGPGSLSRHQFSRRRSRRGPDRCRDAVLCDAAVAAPRRPDSIAGGQQRHVTAREAGYPSLEVEGLVGLFGITALTTELKEKIAADVKLVSADPAIADRLKATGQVVNYGGPEEFAVAIAGQRAKIAAAVKAINFKPKL